MAEFPDTLDLDHPPGRRNPVDVRMASRKDLSTGSAAAPGDGLDPSAGGDSGPAVGDAPAVAGHGEKQGGGSLSDALHPRQQQGMRDSLLPKQRGQDAQRLLVLQHLNIERGQGFSNPRVPSALCRT
jgi:hypothetical protein